MLLANRCIVDKVSQFLGFSQAPGKSPFSVVRVNVTNENILAAVKKSYNRAILSNNYNYCKLIVQTTLLNQGNLKTVKSNRKIDLSDLFHYRSVLDMAPHCAPIELFKTLIHTDNIEIDMMIYLWNIRTSWRLVTSLANNKMTSLILTDSSNVRYSELVSIQPGFITACLRYLTKPLSIQQPNTTRDSPANYQDSYICDQSSFANLLAAELMHFIHSIYMTISSNALTLQQLKIQNHIFSFFDKLVYLDDTTKANDLVLDYFSRQFSYSSEQISKAASLTTNIVRHEFVLPELKSYFGELYLLSRIVAPSLSSITIIAIESLNSLCGLLTPTRAEQIKRLTLQFNPDVLNSQQKHYYKLNSLLTLNILNDTAPINYIEYTPSIISLHLECFSISKVTCKLVNSIKANCSARIVSVSSYFCSCKEVSCPRANELISYFNDSIALRLPANLISIFCNKFLVANYYDKPAFYSCNNVQLICPAGQKLKTLVITEQQNTVLTIDYTVGRTKTNIDSVIAFGQKLNINIIRIISSCKKLKHLAIDYSESPLCDDFLVPIENLYIRMPLIFSSTIALPLSLSQLKYVANLHFCYFSDIDALPELYIRDLILKECPNLQSIFFAFRIPPRQKCLINCRYIEKQKTINNNELYANEELVITMPNSDSLRDNPKVVHSMQTDELFELLSEPTQRAIYNFFKINQLIELI